MTSTLKSTLIFIGSLVILLVGVAIVSPSAVSTAGSVFERMSGPIIALVGAIILVVSLSSGRPKSYIGPAVGTVMIIIGLGMWSTISNTLYNFLTSINPIIWIALTIAIVVLVIISKR